MLSFSQNPTLNQKTPAERESAASHKVLIVPFEPRLYMSEIDRLVNAETGMNAKQIRHKFRDGVNEQLYRAFKSAKFNAIDLMEDTLKYKKDLESIYQYLTYEYLKTPSQQHYKAPTKEKTEKKIEKGQLIVETDGEERFMDARISNPKLLPGLKGKYKTDLFLLVNQLDLKASGTKAPGEIGEGNPNRKAVIHYTLFNAEGKELNSGTVEEDFDPSLNNPKKIAEKHFSKMAAVIVTRSQKALIQPK